MKAYLRSAPLAPKKANIIAKMVRGMSVPEAIEALENTHKKGARMIETLLKSAVANAEHNDKQQLDKLIIKSIIVNQSLGYRRGVPKARGQMRPMTKFLSHISISLGVAGATEEKPAKAKTAKTASKSAKTKVEKGAPSKKAESTKKASAESSESSESSSS